MKIKSKNKLDPDFKAKFPIRIYTDEEIDQFVKDDVIPASLAKKVEVRMRQLQKGNKD